MSLRGALSTLALAALVACGPAATEPRASPTAPDTGAAPASSNTPLERYFPLVHGYIWQYDVTSDDGAQGRLIVRARRTSATAGELLTPGGARRFEYMPEGVGLVDRGVFVLKAPLAPGTRFRGEHGGVSRIDAVGLAVDVPLGHLEGCVRAIEDDPRGVRYATTFCPDVGIVALDVQAGGAHERAELRSYGPPVDLGPAGTSITR